MCGHQQAAVGGVQVSPGSDPMSNVGVCSEHWPSFITGTNGVLS